MDGELSRVKYVGTLTNEKLAQHNALLGTSVVYYHESVRDDPFVVIGNETRVLDNTSPATRPRTCAIALSVVALFCYIPGLIMTFSVVSRGFTNTAVIGLVFTVVAISLSVIAVIMCVKSRLIAKKCKTSNLTPSNRTPESPISERDTSHLLRAKETYDLVDSRSSNDQCQTSEQSRYQHFLLSKRVSQSYVLRRYFDNLYSPSGPFALNQEQMDRMNEEEIRKSQRFCEGISRHKSFPNLDNTESTDSAIGTDSSNPSVERLFVA